MCKAVSDSKEVCLREILSQFLVDDDVHDVSLKGCDGVVVRANRYVLAVRSPVFKAMLLGHFSEASKDVVNIEEYSGSVLRAVVEYIHTDNPKILSSKKEKAPDCVTFTFEEVHTIVCLAAAARFFDLPGLTEKVMDCLWNVMEPSEIGSFHLLEACNQGGPSVPPEVRDFAWSWVRSSGAKSVGYACWVACLSQNTLEEILKDPKMEMTERELFTLLVTWAESGPMDRKAAAKQLVQWIRLEDMPPNHLSSYVESSGLVTSEQLCKAYKAHAMATKEHCSKEKPRQVNSLPKWSNSSSRVCINSKHNESCWGLLQCDPITSGVHKWTLELIGTTKDLMFGVAAKGAQLDAHRWLTSQNGTWGFQGNERVCYEKRKIPAPGCNMATGDQATLMLDLRPDQKGNGTLSGWIEKVNGTAVAIAPIANMLDHLKEHPTGFVPAVEVDEEGGGFRLIRFRKMID